MDAGGRATHGAVAEGDFLNQCAPILRKIPLAPIC